MGQKVSPKGLRIGINQPWSSQWFTDKKHIAKYLLEDNKIRTFLKNKYYACAVSKIVIERTATRLVVNIITARPGMLIGTKGAGVEEIKKEVSKFTDCKNIVINIKEVKKPDIDATLIAESIATQIEKRVAWRRAMKQGLQKAMRAGAKGVKVMIGGRIDGADIARNEYYHEGALPLTTLRADIDYGTATSRTTFGAIGVKVWVFNGDILTKKPVTSSTTKKTEEGGNN
jgi:small subunit ribosomal protein S3